MTQRTFENPFHTVVLNYEETKNETSYEKELVSRYLAFLNAMQEKREQMKALTNRYHYEALVAEQNSEALQKIEELLKPISETADRFKKERVLDIPEYLEMRKQHEVFAEAFENFHAVHVDMLREEINHNEEVFNAVYNWFEEEESGKAYDALDEFAGELYSNYDNYSLDLNAFDDDMEAMKSDWQKADEEWDTFFILREATVNSTKQITHRINLLNNSVATLRDDLVDMNTSWSALNN